MRKRPANVHSQRVVEVVDAGDGADRTVGQLRGARWQDAALVDQYVLDHTNRRPEADASGGAGQRSDQLQEQVEVLGEKGIESREHRGIGIPLVEGCSRQARMRAESLPVGLEQTLDHFLSMGRFREETPIRDLPDVAGVQVDRDGGSGPSAC